MDNLLLAKDPSGKNPQGCHSYPEPLRLFRPRQTVQFGAENAGIDRNDIAAMAKTGVAPEGFQVHHRLPLDDGGTNLYDNLILIRDDVEHRAVHGYYNPGEQRIYQLNYGQSGDVALPMPPKDTIVYPNPSRGYVAELTPNVRFLEIFE